nr:MAG TPA: hypothetical protein [Caudoviricetes sp.]
MAYDRNTKFSYDSITISNHNFKLSIALQYGYY